MVTRAALLSRTTLAIVTACGAHPHPRAAQPSSDDITLYRDAALIKQRAIVEVPASASTIKIAVAAGVMIDHLVIVDRGGLEISGIHAATDPNAGSARGSDADSLPDSDSDEETTDSVPPAKPTDVHLDVIAPHAGRYAIAVAYTTDRLHWDAAYTMTATAARDRALLRGAIAIRNTTGIALRAAHAHVIDAELGAWRGKTAEHLASTLVGGTPSSTQPAATRDLGLVDLSEGETRVELLPSEAPRNMRAVLVYDPIGTKLDNQVPMPLRDLAFGMQPAAPSRITESFEVERDELGSAGLPAGPVRLLERHADGSLAVLGESRLFDAATRVADVDTIAIGTADGVSGHRERREITIDDERHRLTEEFVITIDNARARPIGVLVREHLYRGQNWTLAYESALSAAKEGAQQIALRTTVPAKGQTKLLYVVVYTWQP